MSDDLIKRDDALMSCPFCKGNNTVIGGKGQLWRGISGYSPPQFYELRHYGNLSEVDDFPNCYISFRCRTEAEAIAAWNARANAAAIREAALREAYEVVYKWWFGDGNALPQELILALIGEKK